MNQVRRAFIMAHLVKYGKIRRRDIQDAFGMSGRNATIDLTEFQRLHGALSRFSGRSHVYVMPEGYDTAVPLDCVEKAVKLIHEILLHA